MSDSPPRLDLSPTDPSAEAGYAPISWTAVASLGAAILFAIVLLVMGILASREKQPLLQTWLLILPALAVLFAFIARRQITSSEGTRTGVVYANAGWWMAVVGGLGYAAYLAAIDFDVRRQAEREFVAWSDNLKDLDASNPKDPKLYAATYLTIEPGVRAAVKSPENVAAMDSTFGDRVQAFRQLDVTRICSRNPGKVEFRTHGLQDWEQKPTEISCTLSADLVTPEGEHHIAIPLRAVTDEKTKQRRWFVMPSREGFVIKSNRNRNLTRYGWIVEYTEYTGRSFGQEFTSRLMSAGQNPIVYLGFIHPEMNLDRATQELAPFGVTTPGRAAIGGAAVISPYTLPKMADADSRMKQIFTRPNGVPATPEQLKTFLFCWETPGRIAQAGTILKANANATAVLILDEKHVEMRVPIELAMLGEASGMAAAKGQLILRLPPSDEAELLRDFATARAEAGSSPKSYEPPSEMLGRRPHWRVVRIESDLVPMFNPKPVPGGGGMPGM